MPFLKSISDSLPDRWKRMLFWVLVIVAIAGTYHAIRYLPYTFGETRRYRDAEVFLGISILLLAVRLSVCGFRAPYEQIPPMKHRVGCLFTIILVPLYIFGVIQLIQGSRVVIVTSPPTGPNFFGPKYYIGPYYQKTRNCVIKTHISQNGPCAVNFGYRDFDIMDGKYTARFECLFAENGDAVSVGPIGHLFDDSVSKIHSGRRFLIECSTNGTNPTSYQVLSTTPVQDYDARYLSNLGINTKHEQSSPAEINTENLKN